MEIISRQDAQAAGLNTYFTGNPCKHGHTAYRYVKSATCSACVGVAAAVTKSHDSDTKRAELQAIGKVRQDALEQLVVAEIRCFDVDVPQVRAMAVDIVRARYPMLTDSDIYPGVAPRLRTSGTAMYRFRLYAECVQLIRDFAIGLQSQRSVDVQKAREDAKAIALRWADEQACPVPEFKP